MRFFSLTLIFITLVVPVAIATNNQEKLSTQVVDRSAQQPDFDYYFAEALRQKHLGNTAESIDLFLKSYDINPTSAIVSFELGNLFLQQKADDMGFGYIKNAAELAPQNYFYQEKLALLYRSNGDFSQAIEVLERIQRLFPDKDEVLYELSQLYTQNGQHKKSIQKLDLLEKRIGLNKAITYDKAVQYVLLKNIKQAHKEIDAMLKKTPNDHTLWILKGDIEYERKKYGNAKKYFQKATDIQPESGYVYISWARYYEAIKDFSTSEEYLYKLFGAKDISFQDKMHYLEILTSYYSKRMDGIEKMHNLYTSLLESHPMEYVAHTAYAEFLLQQKLVPEAIEHFYTAALLHPSCLECWVYLLQYYTEKNENEKAYQIAKEAIEAVPSHPVLLFYSGMLALMNDQKEDALVQLLEMIKFTDYNEPNYAEMNAAAHAMLVDLYLIYKKDYPKALEQCDLALKLNPSNHVVMNNCAYTLALQNEQLERAEKLSAQSLEAEPMNVSYLDTYAYILFKQKRYETALFFIEKAMEYTKDGEKNAVVYERYGDILYFLGQQTKALEMWQKALELTQDATDTIKQKVNTKKYVE